MFHAAFGGMGSVDVGLVKKKRNLLCSERFQAKQVAVRPSWRRARGGHPDLAIGRNVVVAIDRHHLATVSGYADYEDHVSMRPEAFAITDRPEKNGDPS